MKRREAKRRSAMVRPASRPARVISSSCERPHDLQIVARPNRGVGPGAPRHDFTVHRDGSAPTLRVDLQRAQELEQVRHIERPALAIDANGPLHAVSLEATAGEVGSCRSKRSIPNVANASSALPPMI